MSVDIGFLVLLCLIGFVASFLSGMLGIGGSIILYPLLLYLPSFLGFVPLTSHQVSGISAIQVFFSTMAGIAAYRKSGYFHRPVVMYMGSGIITGTLMGSLSSAYLAEEWIDGVYALLALLAASMMLFPSNSVTDHSTDSTAFRKGVAVFVSFLVGLVSGIVGAAGAFLLVPVLLVLFKLPVRMTIASSLAVTFLASIVGAIGKVMTGQVLFFPSLILGITSLIASPFGAVVGKKIDPKWLRVILAIIISVSAIQIWIDRL